MAGLLDFLQTPESRMGIGLLAAAGPRADGAGFGQRLNEAMGMQDAYGQNQMRSKLLQSQIDENAAQAKIRAMQAEQAGKKQELLAGLLGGLGGVSTGGGVNMGTPAGGGLASLSLDQVTALKAQGIDLLEPWKIAQQGLKQDAGAYYKYGNGQTQYMPKLGEGQGVMNGQVQNAPGYAESNAQTEGMKAAAVSAAQYPYAVGQDRAHQVLGAQLDPMKTYNPATGRDEYTPRAQVSQPQYSGAGYAGGSAAAAAPEQIRIIQSELDKLPHGHRDRPALERELQRVGGSPSQSGAYAAGPSASETAAAAAAQAKAVGTANADVARDSEGIKKVRSATENMTNADRAIELLQLGPTGSAIGALVDKGAAVVGRSTPGGNIAAQLDIVSANMVKNVPRFEGPQSNIDVDGYKAAAGRVSDRSLPIEQRIAAAKEVKYFEEKAIRQAQGGQSGGASGSWGDKPIPTAAVNDLKMRGPKAHAQFDAVFGEGAAARALGGANGR